MTIDNGSDSATGGWDELWRMQAQFASKLTEETLKYLRGVQASLSPRPPGTVVRADGRRLSASCSPGGTVHLDFTVDNRQRVHTPVSPSITPLVGDDGTTWYPAVAFSPHAAIVAPDDTRQIAVTIEVPDDLEPATFLGSIVLHGFATDGVPLELTVVAEEPAP
jgi:hypothetical protein